MGALISVIDFGRADPVAGRADAFAADAASAVELARELLAITA